MATLHYFPVRANGHLVSLLPSPLIRAAMTVFEWLVWRLMKKVDCVERRGVTIKQAADHCQVSPDLICRLIANEQLDAGRIGRSRNVASSASRYYNRAGWPGRRRGASGVVAGVQSAADLMRTPDSNHATAAECRSVCTPAPSLPGAIRARLCLGAVEVKRDLALDAAIGVLHCRQ